MKPSKEKIYLDICALGRPYDDMKIVKGIEQSEVIERVTVQTNECSYDC